MSTSPDGLGRMTERITYKGACLVVEAAVARATELGLAVSVVVTDTAGDLVAMGRMDGPHASTVRAAHGKATYAATRGRSTEDFVENRLRGDEVLWRAVTEDPDTFLVPGGFPLRRGDACLGGVGVSGAKHADDVRVGQTAADAWHAAVGEA